MGLLVSNMRPEILAIFEAIAASGLATAVAQVYTSRTSSKKQANKLPDPGERMCDEIKWLREQLEVERRWRRLNNNSGE